MKDGKGIALLFGSKDEPAEDEPSEVGGNYSAADLRKAKLLVKSLGLDPGDADLDGICAALGHEETA